MGKKSSAKSPNHNPTPPAAPPEQARGAGPLVVGAVFVAIVGIGVLTFWRSSGSAGQAASASSPSAAASSSPEQQAAAASSGADAKAVARAEAAASLGPHKQATLPPVPFQVGYAPPRSTAVVTAAYEFAAEHPEVLSYVPCFCGCQRAGHQGNADCFVKSRAENGDVIEWDDHGVDCAVCLDVATRSRQMYSSGASVRDIRAAIDKEFGSLYPTAEKMRTPRPPAPDHK